MKLFHTILLIPMRTHSAEQQEESVEDEPEPELNDDDEVNEEKYPDDDDHIEAENEMTRESRLLMDQYRYWKPQTAPTGTDVSRYGRVRSQTNRQVSSNPMNYHPSDIHRALTER